MKSRRSKYPADPKVKIKQQLCWLNHGSYPGSTMFVYNYTREFVENYLKKLKANDWLDCIKYEPQLDIPGKCCCMRRIIEDPKTGHKKFMHIIWIGRPFEFDDWDYCMLAHEVTHLCQFFLPDLLIRDNEIEAEAYFHSHMMQQCLTAMRVKIK